MKKILSLILCAMLVLAIAPLMFAESTYEIAMVTDVGNIDDQSFNQFTWEGVKMFGDANGKTYNYFKPSEDSTDARIEAIAAAIDKGAKVIVTPGYLFIETIEVAQEKFPETNFLFVDHDMGEQAKPNTHCVVYKEHQSGFLAGYAIVKEGYKNLAFLGGVAVPAVVKFGEGFVQGAEYAAKELGINDVKIKYWYANTFAPNDEIKTKTAGWITEGTEVIFAAGGGVVFSALQSAKEGGAKIIGVDVDQSSIDPLIITSAAKELVNSVILSLEAIYKNDLKWPEDIAGKTSVLGAKENCVGLPLADGSFRFEKFTKDDYNAIFEKVKNEEIVIEECLEAHPNVELVKVDYME